MAREFFEVIDVDEAHRRFRAALDLSPRGVETIELSEALGRVLARDVISPVDVPGFDRSNVDGFAVRASDTFGADEVHASTLALTGEELAPGLCPREEVTAGMATAIATGAMIPRGADAVVMVEHTFADGDRVSIHRAATPGAFISFAGSDIARGEVVLRAGARLTARETGTLAALGLAQVDVYRRLRVGGLSTGDEVVPPGEPFAPGLVYDSNLRIISDSLREIGCEPVALGVVGDDLAQLRERVRTGLELDALILSGGTSKGEGDLSARVVRETSTVIAHGVAVKPGKPICLAVHEGKPVVVLPGFPTSAVFTFHEFVVPVLLELSGAPPETPREVRARVPFRLNLDSGRAEFVLVSLLDGPEGLVAYPLGKGSGSVTSYSRADGFVTLARQDEFLDANEVVTVRLLGRDVEPADLVVIGSHCLGLDELLTLLRRRGHTAKTITVGSQGGFLAAERGECDLAGVHLCDADGVYNTPFLRGDVELVTGYGRLQGIVYRDERPTLETSMMINRNRGSGTRILIDELLADARPAGYHLEARSHNAVAAAVAQGRAEWGIAIRNVAAHYDLQFEPLREERYDFVIPRSRRDRPAVRVFLEILSAPETRQGLRERGFIIDTEAADPERSTP